MDNYRFVAVCACLFVATAVFAQSPPTPKEPQPKELPPLMPAPALEPASEPVAAPIMTAEVPSAFPSEIIWFRTDYLLWSLPASRVPFPVITTGNPADDCFAGTIGQPSTRVLFGNDNFRNDNTGGLRFVLGAWLDSTHLIGIEAAGFTVMRENHIFERSSDANGNPPLYLSGFNTQLGREDSAIIADPIQKFGGGVRVNTDLKLVGTEANGLINIRRTERFEWSLLTGLRYLEFDENFNLSATSRDLVLNQQITFNDHFETTNKFFGLQLGSRMRGRYKRFLLDVVTKVALGGNQQTRTIAGESTSTGPDAINPGRFIGGFYSQPSNIGRASETQFAVMPALELKLGYQITSGIIASVGYDLFYLNRTIRVANQIDRNLDLSQSAVFGSGTPTGPPRAPQHISDSSDFFVQGLSLGLEIRY